jgi:hypothetical protein
LSNGFAMSVLTKPSATENTWILSGASATASDWLIECSAALLAPYAGPSGSPRNAPREPTFTIRPPPFVAITFAADWQSAAGETKLTSKI